MPALANMNNSEQLLSSNYNIINHDNYDYHNNGLSSTKGLWSRHRDVVGCNQLQKRADHHEVSVCSCCSSAVNYHRGQGNSSSRLIDKCFLNKLVRTCTVPSFQQEGGAEHQISANGTANPKAQCDGAHSISHRCQDEMGGGLTTTYEGSLTLLECYSSSKSLKGLQIVFDSDHAREQECELLYPDACGGGGRGWITQGTTAYERGHGMRETCVLHTARLSCDTLVDFWSDLGEETTCSQRRTLSSLIVMGRTLPPSENTTCSQRATV